MTRNARVWMGVCALVMGLGTGEAFAAPFTQGFAGEIAWVREFSNNVLVPVAQQEFAPSFHVGDDVTGAIGYDTSLADLDASTHGRYLGASLGIQLPQAGLSISRNSSSVEIRVLDNTSNPDDQFNVFPDGIDTFLNAVGLPTPLSFWLVLFGTTSMLSDDHLPTTSIDWNFGNVSMNLRARDGSERQLLIGFQRAAVPEPATWMLVGCGLLGVTRMVKRGQR